LRSTRHLVPLVAVLALAASACGSSSSPTKQTIGKAEAPLAGLLPKAIRDKGTLVVGSDVAYAPIEFYGPDGTTIMGIDPDLGAAIGTQLGVTLKFVNGTFDGLITQLTSKRIDLVMSALSDTKERQGKIDFVDYFTAGTSILVAKGNPKSIKTLDDFCGKTIALQRGTTQDDVAKAQVKKCAATGNKLTVLSFDKDTEALLQVKSGRAVGDLNDFPVAAYNAKTSGGAFEVVGDQIEAGPYGIGVRKTDAELRGVLQKAVQALIANGEYAKILQKWNVSQGAVTTAVVNGG